MFDDIHDEIGNILKVVEECPEQYRIKCFEILLNGYVEMKLQTYSKKPQLLDKGLQKPDDLQLPSEIIQRIKSMASRIGIESKGISALFDFTIDPFVLQPINIPGDNNAERVRNVVLASAVKSYLLTGAWVADWKEVKSQCINQSCYDSTNHSKNISAGLGTTFKDIVVGSTIELSTAGIKSAEQLIKKLSESE